MVDSLKVVIADDHPLFRDMLSRMLTRRNSGIDVVAEVETIAEAISTLVEHRPEVLLLDLSLPDQTRDSIAGLLEASPSTQIVVVSGHDDAARVEDSARRGAAGYAVKRGAMKHVLDAVIAIASHQPWTDPHLTADAAAAFQRGRAAREKG